MGNGRIGRLRAISYSVWLFLAFLPILILQVNFQLDHEVTSAFVLNVLLAVTLGPINIMFAIRRLHDMNRSGWWSLIQVPMNIVSPEAKYRPNEPGLMGAIVVTACIVMVIYALALIFVPGTKGDNRFGLPPPPNSGWVIAGVIVGILLPFAACTAIVALRVATG